MDPAIKQQWITALRSGSYRQGRAVLRELTLSDLPNYCCLGVLLEITLPENLIERDAEELTLQERAHFGISRKDHDILVILNDGGSPYNDDGELTFRSSPRSFQEIATWIEENL